MKSFAPEARSGLIMYIKGKSKTVSEKYFRLPTNQIRKRSEGQISFRVWQHTIYTLYVVTPLLTNSETYNIARCKIHNISYGLGGTTTYSTCIGGIS